MSNSADEFEDASSVPVAEVHDVPDVVDTNKKKNKKKKKKKKNGQNDTLNTQSEEMQESQESQETQIKVEVPVPVALEEVEKVPVAVDDLNNELESAPEVADEAELTGDTVTENGDNYTKTSPSVPQQVAEVSIDDQNSAPLTPVKNNKAPSRVTSISSKAYSPIGTETQQTLQEPFIAKSEAPSLPNRKSIKDCLRLDQPNAVLNTSTNEEESLKHCNFVSETYRSSSANYLLQSKFSQLNHEFESKDKKVKEQISSGSETIKKTFNDIKNTVGGLSSDFFDYKIDWEFWTRIVNDYENVVQNESNELNDTIMTGIPKEFRGIVWQLIAKSKNLNLEEFYLQLKNEPSIHEKSIRRDLTRTSFFTNVDQIKKTDELFNVIKAYSLFDPDVGYTQGMIFIVVPLIMNMNESECFGLLVTLMKDYRLRDLFSPEMKGLHLLLYEFDRLLEMYSPRLYNHLVKQGIKSSMYASQWFLTFFAYKFPLDIVLRIYDIIITQGIEASLKFAVNLMCKNENNLVNLKFDKLIEFLKSNLFNVYINDEFINHEVDKATNTKRSSGVSRRFSLRSSSANASKKKDYYKLDEFVSDAMEINVSPLDLKKFEIEFENIYVNEKSKVEEIEELRIQNGKLRHDIKLLETEYSNVNRDHVEIVQMMVDIKLTLPEIMNDNQELEETIDNLRKEIEELESKVVSSPETETAPSLASPGLPAKIESDIQELLVVNAQETEKFANLEEELSQLMEEDSRLKQELKAKAGSKKWFWNK